MAEKPKFKKGGGGDSNEVAIAITIVVILALPFIVVYAPRLIAFEQETVAEFLFAWRWYIAPIVLLLDVVLFLFLMGCIFAVWPIRYFAPGPFARVRLREKGRPKEKDPEVVRRFAPLKERLAVPTAENLRLALIEADALVDLFLKRSGYEGEHMADRLSRIDAHEMPSVEGCWDAHRLRNMLVHTPGAVVSPREARGALVAYEKFLKDMGAL